MDADEYNKLTYRQTEAYHTEMRSILFEEVEAEFIHLGIKLREISFSDAQEAESWKAKRKPGRAAEWNWTDLHYRYHSRGGARRFDMALTKNNQLLGLAYGMLENYRLILKIHAMESNPLIKDVRGRMLEITLYAAGAYARLNNSSEIWLCNPVSDAHVRMYSGKGYTPYYDHMDRCTHLIKRIS